VPVDIPAGVIVAVNVIVLLSQAGFLLVASVVVVGVCPKMVMETNNKKAAVKYNFFFPGPVFDFLNAGMSLHIMISDKLQKLTIIK
jgi:hypothetical protein